MPVADSSRLTVVPCELRVLATPIDKIIIRNYLSEGSAPVVDGRVSKRRARVSVAVGKAQLLRALEIQSK